MATDSQIAANRRNARRSTGPRTDAGKARSSANATRHGILASTVAIRRGVFAEDADEVTDFFARVVEQLAPVGPLEESEAYTIAALYVRRGRLLAIESAALAASTGHELWLAWLALAVTRPRPRSGQRGAAWSGTRWTGSRGTRDT